jgi:hypothetical protein
MATNHEVGSSILSGRTPNPATTYAGSLQVEKLNHVANRINVFYLELPDGNAEALSPDRKVVRFNPSNRFVRCMWQGIQSTLDLAV